MTRTYELRTWPIRPTGRPVATINGRPAWQVVEERKRAEKEAHNGR